MKNLILAIVTAVAVSGTAVAVAEEKKQECNTYCNSVNMDGSGSVICQTVCS